MKKTTTTWFIILFLSLVPSLFFISNGIREYCNISEPATLTIMIFSAPFSALTQYIAYRFLSFSALANSRSKESIDVNTYCDGEKCLKCSRAIVYFSAVLLIVSLCFPEKLLIFSWVRALREHKENLSSAIILISILILISSYHSFNRLTFRSLPVLALSISSTLLFLCFTGKAYVPSDLWGLGRFGIDTALISKSVSHYQTVITGSAIITGILAAVIYLGKDAFEKYRINQTHDSAKDTRRHLLTHWHFNSSRTIHDSLTWLIVGFTLFCFIAIMVTIPTKNSEELNNTSSSAEENYNPEVLTEENDSVTDETASNSDVASNSDGAASNSEEESDDEESDSEMLLVYFALMATGFAFLGIVTHFDISEKSLSSSEYYYLLYHSIKLFKDNKDKNLAKWTDYFQVYANLYSYISPILSENREWHNLFCVLKQYFASLDECQKSNIISSSIFIYSIVYNRENYRQNDIALIEPEHAQINAGNHSGNTSSTIYSETETTSNKKKTISRKRLITESEVLFSSDISSLLYNSGNVNSPIISRCKIGQAETSEPEEQPAPAETNETEEQPAQAETSEPEEQPAPADTNVPASTYNFKTDKGLLAYLNELDSLFFLKSELKLYLERFLSVSDISADDFICVIRLDLLNIITQWQTKEDCLLLWLCTKDGSCPFSQNNITKVDPKRAAHNRNVLALEYPFLAFECIERRWFSDEDFDSDVVGRYIQKYFKLLFNSGYIFKTQDTDEIDTICTEFYSFLIRQNQNVFFHALAGTSRFLQDSETSSEGEYDKYHSIVNGILKDYAPKHMSFGVRRAKDNAFDEKNGRKRGTLSMCRNLVYLFLAEKKMETIQSRKEKDDEQYEGCAYINNM